ncbi:hypothetical protein BC941DRAFT_416049 [Chlamydoabsidia padenii]|nr:hypothetical protein BC941DRAFT_416049 [Chlamydoabsidia padenii]
MDIPFSNTTTPNIKPGEILEYDYRPFVKSTQSSTHLKLLQWNVERNYEADGILQKIKALDPDVCVLQEVDIGCQRSQTRNHMEELCRKLQMKGAFVCEFWELDDPIRKPRDAGGGLHGNAILTKYDMTDIRVLTHQHQPYNWEQDGHLLNEPRKGKRYTLSSVIKRFALPPVLVYSVHLEVFTGIIGRTSAFSEILDDAQAHNDIPHQAILGDLNTMAHSIARLSPKYARDRYRLLSLGESEASWFDRNVLGHHIMDGPINTRLLTMQQPSWQPLWFLKWMINHSSSLEDFSWGTWLTGFDKEVMIKTRNPGFYDPWPLYHCTLHNPAYFGLFKAKLDWTLLRNMSVIHQQAGNTDYQLSDHQYLLVQVDMDDDDVVMDRDRSYAAWLLRRKNGSQGRSVSYWMMIRLAVLVVVLMILILINCCT